jgi:hypothetical protein
MNCGKGGNPTKKKRRIIVWDDKDRSEEEADGMTAKEVQGVQSYFTNKPTEAKQQFKAQTTLKVSVSNLLPL